MFDPNKAVRLSVPMWHAVYKAEIGHGAYALIAIHDVTRGPGLGGCRMAQYTDLSEALTDVLRLSRGMTFKNAIADLPLGGGKAVIVCDPSVSGEVRTSILQEYGKFLSWVNKDKERYITAEDMNTTVADIHVVKQFSDNVLGLDVDPSPYTAWGVFSAITHGTEYFADDLFQGKGTLSGKRILVQGLGKVGRTLVDHLHQAGAQLFVTDIRPQACQSVLDAYPEVTVVDARDLYNVEVDIFAPCAGGEVITPQNLNNLKFKILCGAANNQLQNSGIGAELQAKGIVYCPDFVTNMGGVCAIQYMEVDKLSHDACLTKIKDTVERRLDLTFKTGFEKNMPFSQAVNHVVKEIVWGEKPKNLLFRNEDLFPAAAAKI